MPSKHTPGPWTVEHPGEDWWTVLKGAWDISGNQASKPGVVADAKYSAMSPAENEANARLIAAAPDLLEALNAAEECLDPWQHVEQKTKARAAIAKAEGE